MGLDSLLQEKELLSCKMSLALSSGKQLANTARNAGVASARFCSTRFCDPNGASGWKWEKGGVGMGGKEKAPGAAARLDTKEYKSPEYFDHGTFAYAEIEKSMVGKRVAQPDSGLSQFLSH